jgi:activating signal cointegrator 1
MKAITLTQPWATLVAIGAKKIETRGWKTPYRGPLAIHAAKAIPAAVREVLVLDRAFARAVETALQCDPWNLPRGVVLATCRLADCEPTESMLEWISHKERTFGDYRPGRFGFVLEDVTALAEPIPAVGCLGLWELPAAVLERLAGIAS